MHVLSVSRRQVGNVRQALASKYIRGLFADFPPIQWSQCAEAVIAMDGNHGMLERKITRAA
jgi:hypothetical protein